MYEELCDGELPFICPYCKLPVTMGSIEIGITHPDDIFDEIKLKDVKFKVKIKCPHCNYLIHTSEKSFYQTD